MKKNIFIILFTACFIVGCDDANDINYNRDFEIQVNKTLKTSEGTYTLRFDSVMTDSRCPEGAMCVWQGVAATRFTLISANDSATFELFTVNLEKQNWSDSVIYKNLKIKLLKLNPYPSINIKFTYANYRAKLKLTQNP